MLAESGRAGQRGDVADEYGRGGSIADTSQFAGVWFVFISESKRTPRARTTSDD